MRKTAKKGKAKPEVGLVRYPGGVSKSESSHPRYPFVVRWPGDGGKRLVKWFTNDTEAISWAKEKSAEAGELGAAFGSVSEDERAAVAVFRALAAKYDNPKPPGLAEIVRDFAKRWEASRAGATVAATVPAFIEAKQAEGRSAGHLATVGVRLNRFATDFGERVLPSFTTAEISDYVAALRGDILTPPKPRPENARRLKDRLPAERKRGLLSLETRAGYRSTLHSFFEWARKRGMVPLNPVTDADKPDKPPRLPGVLTPDETAAFFAALGEHAPGLVPFWAVRAFAGVREAEAVRMTWAMIDLPGGKITLPATITKTRHAREIEIKPALAAFLAPHGQASGPLCPLSPMARRWHLRLAMRLLPKLKLPRNWARHGFATWHLLAFRHAGETALQLGHKGGPELLHSTYAGVGTEAQAKAFWAIRPAAPADNVVAMTSPPEVPAEVPAAEKPQPKRKAAR
jgi:integrase